jgi:hypothetical protein
MRSYQRAERFGILDPSSEVMYRRLLHPRYSDRTSLKNLSRRLLFSAKDTETEILVSLVRFRPWALASRRSFRNFATKRAVHRVLDSNNGAIADPRSSGRLEPRLYRRVLVSFALLSHRLSQSSSSLERKLRARVRRRRSADARVDAPHEE